MPLNFMPNETDPKNFHMAADEFRRHGHAVVDWIADYLERVETLPVLSQVKPGEIRAGLPQNPPVQGEPFKAILADVDKLILPGITHWQSPNFYAYFPATARAPRSSGISSPPAWACRECFGPPAPPAPNWKLTSSTGWRKCWRFRKSSFRPAPEAG